MSWWVQLIIFLIFAMIGFAGHRWWLRWRTRRYWKRQARNTAWLLKMGDKE